MPAPVMARRALAVAAVLFASAALLGCRGSGERLVFVTATPPISGSSAGGAPLSNPAAAPQAALPQITPPGEALPIYLPTPTFIPTPDATRPAVVDPTEDQVYVVQPGDTLNAIGLAYGVSVDAIALANDLTSQSILEVGQTLTIPLGIQGLGVAFKLLPDSALVYGPSLRGFSTEAAVAALPDSFLANYTEDLGGQLWTGAEIVERVALEQSISPRVLLALLEYESQWLSQSELPEEAILYPMHYHGNPAYVYGLYRQLDYAAKVMQVGYYGWRLRGFSAVLMVDGSRAGLHPTLNAGTAAVQTWLAQNRTIDAWLPASGHAGFFATYVSLFGDPFLGAVEPLLPANLEQPPMTFPWAPSETWYYTGGPHGGWGSGSAWSSLDFVSAEEVGTGCELSDKWARAVADGVIARSEYGTVVLDLDGDGYEGTGWTVVYLHISSEGRPVAEGDRVEAGDPIGHPSCEGGISYATHLHIGRRYNGEWIAADCTDCIGTVNHPQLNFDGWLAYSFGSEYDGALVRGEEYREACVCREPLNTFAPTQAR